MVWVLAKVLFLLAFLSKGVFDILQVNEAFVYELMEGGEQEESQNKESKEKLELFSYSEQFPIKSSFFTSTTIPELAYFESLLEGDMPFTTISPGAVAAGTINPPGHIQNE